MKFINWYLVLCNFNRKEAWEIKLTSNAPDEFLPHLPEWGTLRVCTGTDGLPVRSVILVSKVRLILVRTVKMMKPLSAVLCVCITSER